MPIKSIETLFNVSSHNPSFNAVKESGSYRGQLRDFCIPVNLHFPPAALMEKIRRDLPEILRYYPDYADVHQKSIAAMIDLDAETIVPANGSTEIITLLCQQAAGPMVTSVPTFGRWTDLPLECGVPLHTIQREAKNMFRLSVNEIVRRVREVSARTLVISNPNNPTGQCLSLGEIKSLTAQLGDLHTVVVDESFIDFSDIESAGAYAASQKNLVVVKSMGKSLGWHGVRLGYAVAAPERARQLRAKLPFWNINGLAAYVLRHVHEFKAEYRSSFARVREDRDYMGEVLARIPGLTVYPSQANFFFVRLPEGLSGRSLRDRLLEHYGVMVRENSNKVGSSEQYLRIAVQAKPAVGVLEIALRSELSRVRSSAALSA
jgi:threonine-phosphate decarboxylase